MKNFEQILRDFKELNKKAKQGGIVFFGTDWLAGVPIGEIARDNGLETAVYNRSINGAFLRDGESCIDVCVTDLKPCKVFINMGENDVKNDGFDEETFFEKYEWMLYTINAKCKCEIYILSVFGDKSGAINKKLRALAENYGCEYIDIGMCEKSHLNFFSKIRFFMRTRPITFFEAMTM